MKLLCIAGARPNFMKIGPLMDAFQAAPDIDPLLVHTGQHYDEKMSDLFFRQLGIPEPAYNLGVGGGSHAAQTASIMTAFEPVLVRERPEAILVVGDVNSTIACALVASKLGVKIIHVEAGLRSFDRSMPEEINRVLTDSISDLLFCSESSGVENLVREGIAGDRVHMVGNVMIDSLLKHLERARALPTLTELGLKPGKYALATLHRPSNVDTAEALANTLEIIGRVQTELPVFLPLHPRTRQNLDRFGLRARLDQMTGVRVVEPLGYLEFLNLMASARLVLTDSGGIQEETTILRVPCVTLRENTERPVTCEIGSNRVAGMDPERVHQTVIDVLRTPDKKTGIPPLWDGQAAGRIAGIIASRRF
jgi:UDP-N-acetylglucosamine 2-epimerase (non-hydrolysing)